MTMPTKLARWFFFDKVTKSLDHEVLARSRENRNTLHGSIQIFKNDL